MVLQFCTMAMVHCNNAVWVPMPIIHPENWLPVVKNSHARKMHMETTTNTTSICQLLGVADAQTTHHAKSNTAPAHQPLGSANAETTPAGAPAAAADRKQRPDATCGGKNG